MRLTDESCEAYRRIYKEEMGEDITLDEAREMAARILNLYELITQPLPGETGYREPGTYERRIWS